MAEQNFPLKVNLIGNAASLNAALTGASSKLNRFSRNVKNIGMSLSRNLTLPLGIAAGAAIKTALDFDKSMTKITTLVGVSTDEVNNMRDSVRRLAADTGVNANATADALFFITSAGLRGSDALKVLEASAKASAIGLGEVKTIADAVTSAVNAYGMENLSAEQATDVLTAAVREGKLEADSLAQSMGKVLPVSSQLGVRFDEVGAALAAMSRTGTDAAMASTSLRGILSALLNPSKQANDELEKFGLSAQGLRDQLETEGLLAVLKTLTQRFGDNQEAAGKVFGNIRALTGVLDLMGKNVGSTEQIFANMEDTTGTLNKGFQDLEGSLSFQFKKALEEVRTSFGKLGETLGVAVFPFIKKITDFITKSINKFNNLDQATKNLVLTLGGIAIAIGPAIAAFGLLGSAIAIISSPITLVVAGIALIALAIEHAITKVEAIKLRFEQFGENVKIIARAIGKSIVNIFSPKTLKEISKNMALELRAVNEEFDKSIDDLDLDQSLIEKISETVSNVYKSFQNAGSSLGTAIGEGIDEGVKKTIVAGENLFPIVNKAFTNIAVASKNTWDSINESINKTNQAMTEYEKKLQEAKVTTQMQGQAMQAVMNTFANQLANAFAGGTTSIKDFASQVLIILGDLLIQAGTFAILTSKLMEASFIPIVGVAAGLAAIAVGAMLKGLATKVQNEGIQPFAKGGIVSGPTIGLIGEYAGARHNPEVVAPLNKLKSMIGDRGSATMNGEFVVRGQDLILALQRAERNRNRFK